MPTLLHRAERKPLVDRLLGAVVAAAAPLVVPVSLLLFLQWPLRELVQAYSREANDLAQIVFACYVAVAITAATRAGTHLAADTVASRLGARLRRVLTRLACLTILVPWAGFLLWTGWAPLVQSVRQLEGFPETFNPGYFLIRVALAVLALLVLLQALSDALGTHRRSG